MLQSTESSSSRHIQDSNKCKSDKNTSRNSVNHNSKQ